MPFAILLSVTDPSASLMVDMPPSVKLPLVRFASTYFFTAFTVGYFKSDVASVIILIDLLESSSFVSILDDKLNVSFVFNFKS